jgi:alpha-beta hydrolase superfamily lysophospholipase
MTTMIQTQVAPNLRLEDVSSSRTQYFERTEGTLAYTDYGGNGELVLMLPGMGMLRSEYRYLAPILREAGFRPVPVDLRGQGDSSVPWQSYDVPAVGTDILSLIEHLDSSSHVIATSYSPPPIWSLWNVPKASAVGVDQHVRT